MSWRPRFWLRLVAAYHNDLAHEHAAKRDQALRALEEKERARRNHQAQREIRAIVRRGPPRPAPRPQPRPGSRTPTLCRVARPDDIR